ncbi:hypothetical protein MIND_01051700 [Mycena indigotica]|uniref:DUF21-domain-containing protein n=1 Tax=Mycena indigotica TaxID=2126181 RepID=A0A8H6SA16_9AGAR|nr:uncharacterized protein MIND_01051700 [Mycena indigotica]KAF7295132.1 hypothetical protein MIND_01051700 [Mycena indigotica]
MRTPALLLLTRVAFASPLLFTAKKKVHEHPELWSPEFWEKIGVSAVLVLLGGVFAGLTLGLMGLDELHLRVLATSSDDPVEQTNAKKVLKLMEHGRHWVLVVLLLSNVIINESLPIFLDSAASRLFYSLIGSLDISNKDWWWRSSCGTLYDCDCHLRRVCLGSCSAAYVTSIPRRIIPQALSVRYGLKIGATCAPFVLAAMYILAPVAYPIARLLDWVLGEGETHTYKKAELKSFLQFHRTGEEPLHDEEITILNAVLELGGKRVETIMTPIKDVVTLSADAILDDKLMETILLSGYSRFPVHEPGKPGAFIGLLLIKKLLRYDPSLALPVSSFSLSILPEAPPSISCFQALDYFQTGRAHLLLISQAPGKVNGAIGVITLEDIIEEILSEEIIDETDRYEDNVTKHRASRLATAAVMRGIVERRNRGTSLASERTPLMDTESLSRGTSVTRGEQRSIYGSLS